MRWRTKVLPSGTTDKTCERWPRRDRSSHFGAAFLWPQDNSMARRASSLSFGREMVPATESIWMPRKVIAVAAETVLWSAMGKPRSAHVLMAVARCRLVVSVPRGPTIRKSSR